MARLRPEVPRRLSPRHAARPDGRRLTSAGDGLDCTTTQMNKRRAGTKGCCGGLAELLPPRLFKALSDPRRVALLARVAACAQGCTVTEAARCCAVDLSVVSRHLAQLRDAGVLEATRRGKEVVYAVRAAALAEELRALADALARCAAGRPAAGRRNDGERGSDPG
jgi:ArsR family transcriptional regulator, arsenate/arsenite/antimonite-responsive transcriptional repressor